MMFVPPPPYGGRDIDWQAFIIFAVVVVVFSLGAWAFLEVML